MLTLPEILSIERPLLGVDLETTGTSDSDRIVELGLEIMWPGRPVKEYRTLINPGVRIPPGATAVHHITDEMVKDAPRFEQLADNLLKGMIDCDYAGFNVRFDLRMLTSEFKRVGRAWNYEGARIIDGFRLWQVAEGRSLEHARKRWLADTSDEYLALALGQDGPHTALFDVKLATRVIAAQLQTCPQLPRDLTQLHELCSPGYYDAEGKFQWKDGVLTISFGAHRGKAIDQIPPSYFKFILKADFSDRVKELAANALEGYYPEPPAVTVEDADDVEA